MGSSFLSRTIKHHIKALLKEKQIGKNVQVFDQSHGLTPNKMQIFRDS